MAGGDEGLLVCAPEGMACGDADGGRLAVGVDQDQIEDFGGGVGEAAGHQLVAGTGTGQDLGTTVDRQHRGGAVGAEFFEVQVDFRADPHFVPIQPVQRTQQLDLQVPAVRFVHSQRYQAPIVGRLHRPEFVVLGCATFLVGQLRIVRQGPIAGPDALDGDRGQ